MTCNCLEHLLAAERCKYIRDCRRFKILLGMSMACHGLENKAARFHGDFFTCILARTAQGGGESFKDRKPIGEVGCCE